MHLSISNFKCHSEIELDFSLLTIIAGRNDCGKSTLTQAILLHQTAINISRKTNSQEFLLPINGPYNTYIGKAVNTRSKTISNKHQATKISLGEISISATFDDPDADTLKCTLDKIIPNDALNLNLSYISAERLGPRLIQSQRKGHLIDTEGVGPMGENCAEFLQKHQRKNISSDIKSISNDSVSPWLIKQAEHYMSLIFGEIAIKVEDNGLYAPPSLSIKSGGFDADWLPPTNHGFGISYALPVIITLLNSSENDLIIIDSPEAHLHPAAQTEMARIITKIALSGRRVIVETHSDHFIDGVRLSIAASNDPATNATKAKCLFFQRDSDGSITHTSIIIRPDGTLSQWPSGFFDQMTINLQKISKIKKNREQKLP
ncbi:MAG: DUF3696 domain-containing protein [Fluviicoccus sp.]|uniref:DUF3696 domain-containing protein n=1 Tax=Fluviicoccus sp. TaxID=2003552 RepID=UPI00271A1975|nr:DUF3696 domain-containing protein [Fluviicoccus sp.]MDO8329645.1 DUF3696 domain-containing protein [Fluviicoccus sp.]